MTTPAAPLPFERTTEVRFALDAEDGLWFQCPHTALPHRLPSVVAPQDTGTGWAIIVKEPLTVVPSIHAVSCGCHGFITKGVWQPVPTPEPAP